jgi:hypothetical protein
MVNEWTTKDARALEKTIETGTWGFLFIWFGIALVAHVGWGAGLVGVGLLTVAAQLARRWLGLTLDRSSVVIGSLFIVGGAWQLLEIRFALVPLLCIVAGIALVASAVRRATRSPRTGVS